MANFFRTLVLASLLASPAVAQEGKIDTDFAVLRWLDKITGRIENIEAEIGQTIQFGTLEIIVRTCKKNPPEDTPENAAFLDVWEVKPGEPAEEIFRGWMFSSSPGLSAMEHPVYDVWVLSCENNDSTLTPAQ